MMATHAGSHLPLPSKVARHLQATAELSSENIGGAQSLAVSASSLTLRESNIQARKHSKYAIQTDDVSKRPQQEPARFAACVVPIGQLALRTAGLLIAQATVLCYVFSTMEL